jgi:hypothetical protein
VDKGFKQKMKDFKLESESISPNASMLPNYSVFMLFSTSYAAKVVVVRVSHLLMLKQN